MNRIAIIVCAMLMLGSCNHNVSSKKESTRAVDSIFTIEYINHICRTQPQRALDILDVAEEKELLKPNDINGMRAMVYQNAFVQTNIALKYAKRIYDSSDLKQDTVVAVKTMKLMAALSYQNSHYADALKYAGEGSAFASEVGDKRAEAYFLQFAGFSLSELGQTQEAVAYIDRANDIFQSLYPDTDWKDIDEIFHGNLQKANIYIAARQYDKSLACFDAITHAYKQLEQCAGLPEGLLEKRACDMYYIFMIVYYETGDKQNVEKCYNEIVDRGLNESRITMIMPYLVMTRQFDKALQKIKEAKSFFISTRDTISNYYVDEILSQEMLIYKEMKQPLQALAVAEQMAAINDSIVRREREQNAIELATVYDIADKERQIIDHKERLRTERMITIMVNMLLIIALVVISMILRYNRIIKRKNKAAVAMIDELLASHGSVGISVVSDDDADDAMESCPHAEEIALIKSLKARIERERLYLAPQFDRNKAAELMPGITVKVLSTEFNRLFNTSFPKYLTTLRLEYSLLLLCADTKKSVEAVAIQSGFFTRQTYYRAFTERFGITPAEYRENKTMRS